MCGLLGFIGQSIAPEFTRQLTTSLFIRTQIRGIDASGFYCAGDFDTKDIFYYKKPTISSLFVNESEYKSIWKNKLNMGMFHCRAASQGVGTPAINHNNHPFVSKCNKKAVIHNGLIPKPEYDFYKQYYDVETNCDSEMFLRILEQDNDFFNGISNFYAHSTNSQYAVCYGHVEKNLREIYLFRNEHRPLFIADLTQQLGQIFFFSTFEIYSAAVEDIRLDVKNAKIYELKPYRVARILLNDTNNLNMEEYSVSRLKSKDVEPLSYFSLPPSDPEFSNNVIFKEDDPREISTDILSKYMTSCKIMEAELLSYLKKDSIDNHKVSKVFNFIRDLQKKQDAYRKILEEK